MPAGEHAALAMMVAATVLSNVAARAAETNAFASHPRTTFCYKQVGDCRINADVYRGEAAGPRPAIVWIHGGALISGNRNNLHPWQRDRYLGAGFNVISIDYRLAPETKIKSIIEDLRDAFKWVRRHGPELAGIDPERIAVVGHSAGGYLALMSGVCVKPRPKAIVAFYGYGDIAGAWYSRPDPYYSQKPAVAKESAFAAVGHGVISETSAPERFGFYLYCRQNGLWPLQATGHDPDKEPKAFDPFCPVRNVTGKYPPTLLLHGDKDTDVPYEQSLEMAKMLERHHVQHELITMTNRGHGFDGGRKAAEDPAISATFDRVLEFLKNHVR